MSSHKRGSTPKGLFRLVYDWSQEPGIADKITEIISLGLDHILLPRDTFEALSKRLCEKGKERHAARLHASIQDFVSKPLEGSISTTANEDKMVDTGLVAIALVVRSRDGPRFVYHYPTLPDMNAPKPPTQFGTELDEESSTNESINTNDGAEDSDLEDDDYHGIQQSFGNLTLKAKVPNNNHFDDNHYDSSQGEHIVPWEHLGEFSTTDLESILTQPRAYNKGRFELSLDPLDFLSYPVHIREDGLWKKKKAKKARKVQQDDSGSADEESIENGKKTKEKGKETNSEDGDDHGGMTMFNIVLVLNIRRDDKVQRLQEIYDHVVKKFNKALKHAQASSNYVWKESERILAMKEKAREERRPMSWLWNEIAIKSTLAAAIRDVFLAISNNRIATVQLGTTPPLDLSLQIPVLSFLTSLPTALETAMLGLPVTSANPFTDEEGNADPNRLNKHYALLLLDGEDKVIEKIQSDGTDLSAALIECIRLCKPTLSFAQIAQANTVELPDLLLLAHHLISWRRAIAIPPLHPRDTYIVSPNADNRKIVAASIAWKKAFPLAPPLANFLGRLSAPPRPYKQFFPSKNHRPIYLNMLAWLVRGGWVTQLRSHGRIIVWPKIIYEVSYQLKAEALHRKAEKGASATTSSESTESTEDSGSGSDKNKSKAIDPSAPLTTEQAAENARLERLALKAAQKAAADAAEFSKKPIPIPTDHPSCNNSPHLAGIAPYIIIDPHKVSHEESLYIAAIGKRFTDQKAKDGWLKISKYFNGLEALETISLREGMKRKETWAMIMNYQEYIVIVKHW